MTKKLDTQSLKEHSKECFPFNKKSQRLTPDIDALVKTVNLLYHPLVIGKNVFIYNIMTGLYEKENSHIKALVNTLADLAEFKGKRPRDEVYNRTTMNLDCIISENEFPFDRQNAIGFNNGVLVFSEDGHSYELKNFSPEYRITRKFAVDFNPDADRNLFAEELGGIWIDSSDVEKLYLPIVSSILQSLPDHQPVKLVWIFVGRGNSGKSTYVNFLERCVGERFVGHLSMQQLCDENNRFDRFTLIDKIINIGDDIAETKLRSVAQFKSLTGSLNHAVEDKGKTKINARITATNIFTANYTPEVSDDVFKDDAFWRRIQLVEFPNYFATDPVWLTKHFRKEMFESFLLNVIELVMKYSHGLPKIDINKTRNLWKQCRPDNALDRVVSEYVQTNTRHALGSYVTHQSVQENFREYVCSTTDTQDSNLNNILTADVNVTGKALHNFGGLESFRPTINGKRTWCYKNIELIDNHASSDDSYQKCLELNTESDNKL